MGIEFMIGGAVFSLLTLAKVVAGIFLLLALFWVFKPLLKDNTPTEKVDKETARVVRNRAFAWIGMFMLVIILSIFGGSSRLTIEPTPNRNLIEYQHNEVDLEIKTPEPRTKIMDGFKPLGE